MPRDAAPGSPASQGGAGSPGGEEAPAGERDRLARRSGASGDLRRPSLTRPSAVSLGVPEEEQLGGSSTGGAAPPTPPQPPGRAGGVPAPRQRQLRSPAANYSNDAILEEAAGEGGEPAEAGEEEQLPGSPLPEPSDEKHG